MLVDKENDTIQKQMFTKTGFRGRPSIVIPQEQLEWYLEHSPKDDRVWSTEEALFHFI